MTTPVDPFAEMEARRAEQLAEYGTYVAAEQVWVGSTLAYDVGHPIPASNVESDGSVVTLRHYCPPPIPGQPECPVENNKVLQRSAPGAAVKVDQAAPVNALTDDDQAATKAARTTSKTADKKES
jgi:hypothetical protein